MRRHRSESTVPTSVDQRSNYQYENSFAQPIPEAQPCAGYSQSPKEQFINRLLSPFKNILSLDLPAWMVDKMIWLGPCLLAAMQDTFVRTEAGPLRTPMMVCPWKTKVACNSVLLKSPGTVWLGRCHSMPGRGFPSARQ